MSLARQRLTPQEYLALERAADFKSEYLDGQMYAMAGANQRHNLIVANLTRELGSQFKGRPPAPEPHVSSSP
ncbi:MAG: Uma2 family endonuclease [Candidatus Eremiobacterota bacterium]